MAITNKSNSLIQALQYTSLRELPQINKKNEMWVNALALVKKADGTESYVYVVKDGSLNDRIVADFGNISSIKEIVEYYPIEYLNQSYIPKFKTQKKEERIKFLSLWGYNDSDLTKKSVKELDRLVLSCSVKQQLQNTKK